MLRNILSLGILTHLVVPIYTYLLKTYTPCFVPIQVGIRLGETINSYYNNHHNTR